MRTSRILLCASALFVLGSMSQMAEACVATYTDSTVDMVEGEVEAWALVEDYFDSGSCFQTAYNYWYPGWAHAYEATVHIESPTQGSVDGYHYQDYVSFGGGSAYAFASISFVGDPGEYDIVWTLKIWCTRAGLFVDFYDAAVVVVPPCIHHGTPQNGSLSNDVSLPNSGQGFYHFLGSDSPDSDDWSCPGVHLKISDAGAAWIPSPRIGVGDLSLQGGGLWQDHSSHQNGLDVDMRYVRSDGQEAPLDLGVEPMQLDVTKTKALLSWLCDVEGATVVYLDTVAVNAGVTASCTQIDNPEHINHFHVRFPDPDGTGN